ncbi:MAG: hypothetical protein GQ531_10140 [Sulfurovum sp.]|nr:hypothetical protein [Sulfurovum sp.]
MQNDFEPKSLKEANKKLDTQLNKMMEEREENGALEKEFKKSSLWKKFLRLFS